MKLNKLLASVVTAALLFCSFSVLPARAATQEGIDVSHYDEAVDFAAVKASGRTFAYIKATDGYGTGLHDAWYLRNSASATAAGVTWGPYHFFRAYSVEYATQQANFFWNSIKGTGYTLKPVVDIETYEGQKYSSDIRACLQAFCDRFEQLSGEKPVIYTYTRFITDNALNKYFSDYLLWQAQYSSSRTDTDWSAQVWQYSESGSVPGVTANGVDLDCLYDTSVFEGSSIPTQATKAPTTPASQPAQTSPDVYRTSLPYALNSRAGADFDVLNRYGSRVGNHEVSKGDRICILSVDYSKQLAEIVYPVKGGYMHGYIHNCEGSLHNYGYNKWCNGKTKEPVYDKNGNRIGTIDAREKATVLHDHYVLYSTAKGGETKSGFVRFGGVK